MDSWREDWEFWIWLLRRNVFRILLLREGDVILSIQKSWKDSQNICNNTVWNKLRLILFRFYYPRTDKFTEEDDCKNEVDCLNQPVEPNNFVRVKFATKRTVKYFVGLTQELGPDNYKIKFFTSWILCYSDAEDTATIDPSNILLNSPHPLFQEAVVKWWLWILPWTYQIIILIKSDIFECRNFPHLRQISNSTLYWPNFT